METFQRTNLLMGRVDGLVIFPGVDWWCLGVFANLISCAFSLVSLVLFQSRLRSAPQPANKKVFQRLKDWLKQYQNTPEVCKFSDFHAPSWMTWCVYTLLKDWFRGFDLESDKAQRGGTAVQYPGLYRVNRTTSAYVMKFTKTQPMSMHVGPCLEISNNVRLFFPYYNQL